MFVGRKEHKEGTRVTLYRTVPVLGLTEDTVPAVFRIRISLNADADPDPGFYLNADSDTDPDSGFRIMIQGFFSPKNYKFSKISNFY